MTTPGLLVNNATNQAYTAFNTTSASNPNSGGANAAFTLWPKTADPTHLQWGANGGLQLQTDPSVAGTWNSTTAYTAGSTVFSPSNNSLYRAKTVVATGGTDPALETYFNLSTLGVGATQTGDLLWDRLSFPSSQAVLSFPQSGGFALPWTAVEVGVIATNMAQQTIRIILESGTSTGLGVNNFSAFYDITLSSQGNHNLPVYWAPNSTIGMTAIDCLDIRTVCDNNNFNRISIRHNSSSNQMPITNINITIVYWGSNTNTPYMVWQTPSSGTDSTLVAPIPQNVQYATLPFAASTTMTHPNWAVGQQATSSVYGNNTIFDVISPMNSVTASNEPAYDTQHWAMLQSVTPWQQGGYYDLGAQTTYRGQVYQSVKNASVNISPPSSNFLNIVTGSNFGATWNTTSTYSQGTWVIYSPSGFMNFYVALTAVAANVIPSSNPTSWVLMNWNVPAWGPEFTSTVFGKLVLYAGVLYIYIGAGTAPTVPITPSSDATNWLAAPPSALVAWSSATAYTAGTSVVKLNNIVYAAIVSNTNQNPSTATTFWVPLNFNPLPWQLGGGGWAPAGAQVKLGNGAVAAATYYLATASAGTQPNLDTTNWRLLGALLSQNFSGNTWTNVGTVITSSFTLVKQNNVTNLFCSGMAIQGTVATTGTAITITLASIPTNMMPVWYTGTQITGQGNSPVSSTVREMAYEIVVTNLTTTSVLFTLAFLDGSTSGFNVANQYNSSWTSGILLKVAPFHLTWLNSTS